MFPVSGDTPMHVRGFPRVCGDVSLAKTVLDALNRLSPRMRGCFQCLNAPTAYRSSFPRVCGDVSPVQQTSSTDDTLSPRMRGCFYPAMSFPLEKTAFPAYAGMFPASCTRSAAGSRFPRVCGDVSIDKAKDITVLKLSPRMRGCF